MATLPAAGDATAASASLADSFRRASRRRRANGRTPSEMLARKQQLLAAAATTTTSANNSIDNSIITKTTTLINSRTPTSSMIQTLSSEDDKIATTTMPYYHAEPAPGVQLRALSQGAAEQKLESLSALVREKQQQEVEEQETEPSKLSNVYILLAKKEKDLQLAAELGKVLLERNDELSKANEKITEEYSHKLELLEQEKHKLKRKLDQLDGEYENRLIELQTDCNILKNQLDQREQSARQAEKEKAKLIDDLVQQNSRLTRELAEATKSEELLSSQLEQVNERMNARLSNRFDHAAQVDALQDEVQILNQRKQDLERRLKLAQCDKMNLSATIDESSDKILLLENLLNERDSRSQELLIEVQELRDSSSWLAAKLESMISLNERVVNSSRFGQQQQQQHSHPAVQTGASVELDGDDSLRALSERERSQLIEQLRELRLRTSSRIKASNELLLMNQMQAGHLEARHNSQMLGPNGANGDRSKRSRRFSATDEEEEEENSSSSSGQFDEPMRSSDSGRVSSLDALVDEIYHLLDQFQTNLELRREQLDQQQQLRNGSSPQKVIRNLTSGGSCNNLNASSNADDSGILEADETERRTETGMQVASKRAGKAPRDARHWRRMLEKVRKLLDEMPCSSCRLMISERSDYEQLQRRHTKLEEQFKVSQERLLSLEALRIEHSTRLGQLEERCQLLAADLEISAALSEGGKSREQIVQLAWQARDEAVGRKNATEIALAKTRIENMQIASQLMEVVQQKGELSQKLAQFEDDIHYMTQRSVQNKFTWEELRETDGGAGRRGSNLEDANSGLGGTSLFMKHATTQALSNFWSKLQNAQIKS